MEIGVTKALKRMFVLATRQGLDSIVLKEVDPVIAKAKVSAEYPIDKVSYPSIWVTSSFGNLSWISLNSMLVTNEGIPYNMGEFIATIHYEAIALTAEERDALIDALVNMVMFGQLQSDSDKFYKYLANEPYLRLTMMNGEMKLAPESVTVGTPFDERQIAYTRSASFTVHGEFAQRLDNRQLIKLSDIDIDIV